MLVPPPSSPLFPYTTLFRSAVKAPARLGLGPFRLVGGIGQGPRLRDDRGLGRAPLVRGRVGLRDPHGPRIPLSGLRGLVGDRKSTRLNSSHTVISYAVFCLQ